MTTGRINQVTDATRRSEPTQRLFNKTPTVPFDRRPPTTRLRAVGGTSDSPHSPVRTPHGGATLFVHLPRDHAPLGCQALAGHPSTDGDGDCDAWSRPRPLRAPKSTGPVHTDNANRRHCLTGVGQQRAFGQKLPTRDCRRDERHSTAEAEERQDRSPPRRQSDGRTMQPCLQRLRATRPRSPTALVSHRTALGKSQAGREFLQNSATLLPPNIA